MQDCCRELLQLSLIELVKLSTNQTVAVDIPIPVQTVCELAEPKHVIFLVTTPERVSQDYYNRPGHKEIYDCIMSLSNPQKSLANTNKMLEYSTQVFLDELFNSKMFYIMRDNNSTIECTLAMVEQYFGINDELRNKL